MTPSPPRPPTSRSSLPSSLPPSLPLFRRPGPVRRWLVGAHARAWLSTARRARGAAGQSTVEYALVLLAAATVALALVAWVTRSDAVGRLFDGVVGRILRQSA